MKISENGIDFIKKQEGEKLKAYLDSVGVWTIGVGHTKTAQKGMTITSKESAELLDIDLDEAENAVNTFVKSSLNQNQFDALVSLVFNIGVSAFKQSSLVRYLNVKDYKEAASRFLQWNKGRVRGVLIEITGLTNRRKREKALFDTI